jgi:nitric oxide reductase subunit C
MEQPVVRRRRMIGFLVAAFWVQTGLVYFDSTGRRTPPLSDLAARGQDIWHSRNCQSCHQIYGFGGFLGPDLTNSAESLTEARLEQILVHGSGLMPAFGLDRDDRAAVHQFLVELDKTGVGQPRARPKLPIGEILDAVIAARVKRDHALSEDEAIGREVMRRERCLGCHLPNHGSLHRAPDLTTAIERRGDAGVRAVLASGVPGKAMPKYLFSAADEAGVIAFLHWLGANRESVASAFESTRPGDASFGSIPWFEYE